MVLYLFPVTLTMCAASPPFRMFEAQSDIQKPIRLLPRKIVQVHQKSAYGADYKVGARIDGSAGGQS
jgi:hypothetical protein